MGTGLEIPRDYFNVLSESPLYHNFSYIFLGFSPFPRRTHRVRTAGMSLSKKNLSQNSCIKRLRENIIAFSQKSCITRLQKTIDTLNALANP